MKPLNQFSIPNVSQAVLTKLAGELNISAVDDVPTEVEEGPVTATYDYDSATQVLTITVLKHPLWVGIGFIQSEFLGNLRTKCGYTG